MVSIQVNLNNHIPEKEIIKKCEQFGSINQRLLGLRLFITESTTTQKFDQWISSRASGQQFRFEDWEPDFGLSSLHIAALKGNTKLIYHIVKKTGKNLLNIGNPHGMTPLYIACLKEEGVFQYDSAKEILRLGADVNIGLKEDCNLEMCCSWVGADRPRYAGCTPLWEAAEKTQDVALLKLLLKHGAIESDVPKFSLAGKVILQLARKEIEEEKIRKRIILSAYFKEENKDSNMQRLPQELVAEILSYLAE